ncbi:MAG: hypothetical protein H6Q90_1665 [Deltaproteobacteria bacterium]|nr:hypothetical protein [Deltaproteobacteria bacterium]
MKRNHFLLAVTVALGSAGVVGCGDNSKQCGAGTTNIDGVCTGGGGAICGDGTMLDEATGSCVPSDAVCGDGTVLVNGTCQDPTGNLTIDLEEGPEPNGFEAGATPAGTIALKPANGTGFVIHGCIKPTDNFTADLDAYQLTVTGPTLIKISADGVHGLAAGFAALGDLDQPLLANWLRLGLNVSTDTSKRELFLPAAGTYSIVIADTRTLMPITEGASDLPPAGNLDGTSCYFVTVDLKDIPAPAPLPLTGVNAGDAGTIGEDLKFYAGPFPTGFTGLTAVIDPEDLNGDGTVDVNSRAASSLVVLNNTSLRQINDADNTSPISAAFFGGIKAGDAPLVVLDYVWNYTVGPADYAITVDAALASDALATDGTAVTATGGSHGQVFQDSTGTHFDNLNLFHFDVAAANEVDGFDLTSSIDLQGVLVDQDGFFASQFTGLDGNATDSTTFAAYQGLLRFAAPGRYYFVVFAPRVAPATAFTVTTTIAAQAPVALTLDTPSAAQTVNQFNSNAFTYDAGTTEPWQLFNATGTGTGDLLVSVYDPTAAFGRLDTMAIKFGGGAGTADVSVSDVNAAESFAFAADGSTPAGRILLDLNASAPVVTNFFVKANPTVLTGTRTFVADISARVYHDFGTIAQGSTPPTVNDEPLTVADPSRRYLFKAAPGSVVTLTLTPVTAALDGVIALIDNAENDKIPAVDATGANQPETIRFTQNASGVTPFVIRSAAPVAGTLDYTLTVQVDPPFYSVASSATAFADACLGGGATVPLDSGTSDEGLTASIAPPAGFTFYGATAPDFIASTNGFLSFNPAITDSNFNVTALPDGLGETNIAPLWDDLDQVVICTKTIGTKLVVQWTGVEFSFFGGGPTVAIQTILDSADNSIEFVYGTQTADGGNGVAGVQSLAGDEATSVSTFAPVAQNTSKKLTHP